MPTFLLISRHTPENCPMNNEKKRKANLAYFAKWDAWSKKYKVKMVGAWSVQNEHVTFLVIEAPSLEAFQKLRMEPEARAVAATETVETKIVVNKEQIMKMLQKTK
jgi:hypothetical protein